MLSSIVSVSAVCLVLAYSGWDATDFPPGTDFHEENLYQPGNFDLGQWRDGILKWVLIYNEDSDDDRDCCGMIKRRPNENKLTSPEQQNHTNEVFLSTIVTIEWKYPVTGHKVIEDSLTPNSHYLDGINIYTNNKDQVGVHKPELRDTDDQANVHKPALAGTDDQANVHKPGTDDQASVHKPALIGTDNKANVHKPGTGDQASVHKQAVTGTDDQKPISTDIYLPLWSFNFSNDQHNTTTAGIGQNEGRPTGNLLDGIVHDHDRERDVTNVADDLLTLMISFLLAGVLYKYNFRGRRRLRLPKGMTLTPVLYRRGKHLELGLFKYLRHRSVSKSEIVFTPSFCLKDVNYDRPGLELTRRFNIDFPKTWLESRLEINRPYLLQNLPIPGSLNTPNPYLPLTDLVIKSLEVPSAAEGLTKRQPEERLLSPNLTMICEREDREPQTYYQQTTDRKKKSLENQLIQLSYNINYMGSNTTYYEKMTLTVVSYLIRTYTRIGQQNVV